MCVLQQSTYLGKSSGRWISIVEKVSGAVCSVRVDEQEDASAMSRPQSIVSVSQQFVLNYAYCAT